MDRVVALEKLETRIAGLERNSRSSSKPPSTDKGNFTNPPKPKSLRTKSGKKPGGQKGHPGSTLEKTPNPDHIELHRFLPDELFDCPISPGTLAHIVKSGGEKAAIATAPIREALVAGPVLHADETGCTLHGKRHWLHVLSTDRLTCYHRLLRQGYRANPEPPPKAQGQKGRVKRGKSLNLPDRLGKRWEQVVGYFLYPGLYPYDNNQAEREVRPMKVREKISGTFRSAEHAKSFCDIRGVISSSRKQNRPIFEALCCLISAPATLGQSLAQET